MMMIIIIVGVLLQIYACPIYETMDTAWGRKQEGTWSIFNISERFITRVMYLALTTFVAALLPFFVSATFYIVYFVSSLPPPPPSSTFHSLVAPGLDVSISLWSLMHSRCSSISSYTLSLSVTVLVAATVLSRGDCIKLVHAPFLDVLNQEAQHRKSREIILHMPSSS